MASPAASGEVGGDTCPDYNTDMDWEMSMVDKVPGETGVYVGDLDMESFSFGSEEVKEVEGAKCAPELSTALDMKVLQMVIEASANALEVVTGKDVVMVAGKTGKLVRRDFICFRLVRESDHYANFNSFLA